MKKTFFFRRVLFLMNLLVAILLLFCVIAQYLPADSFPFFSAVALGTVPLVFFNLCFLVYWLFKYKKNGLLSFATLLLCFFILPPIYKFSNEDNGIAESDLKIMTFNTRGFNQNEQLEIKNIDSLIIDFVTEQEPDIVCFQEFYKPMKKSDALKQYPYQFIDVTYGKRSRRVIQAIYSKHPILEVAPIEFPKSSNSAVYANILIGKDTIRLYNVHLQSFRIVPEVSSIQNEASKRLFGRISKVVKLQKQQVDILKAHIDNKKGKTIVVGDLNNTSFSNIYKTLKGDFSDSFIEAGSGFGRTYSLKGLPMRIDYIMADEHFEVTSHTNYDVKYSDHYPIMATLRLKSKE